MHVSVTAQAVAAVAADLVVQVFDPAQPLPLARHLRPGAAALVNREPGALTWLETRKLAAPRILLACSGHADASGPVEGGWGDRVCVARQTRRLGAAIERAIDAQGLARVAIAPPPGGIDATDVVDGMMIRAYAPLEFLPDDAASALTRVVLCTTRGELAGVRSRLARAGRVVEAINLARTLADLPGNVGTPEAIVSRTRTAAGRVGLTVKVMGARALERLGMRLLLAVGAGSHHPPRLLLLEHNRARRGALPTVVLVGKGVTHDTGGYDLKRTNLADMSYDKVGAAAVIGAMHAIADLDLPLHVVGIAPLCENVVDARAYRPGDIVVAMDGTSVFIENTDAEGRLVLADCLTFARRFDPDLVVDLASLTEASAIALGEPYAAVFGNTTRAGARLVASGERSGERVWPLPIDDEHAAALVHHRATLRNLGPRAGAACVAAAFLRHFVRYPWLHVDMADKGLVAERDEFGAGATGWGVRLLVDFAEDFAREHAEGP